MTPSFLSLANADADTVFTVTAPDGAVLPVYEFKGPDSGPTLLFGHANGFPTGAYAPWLKALAKDVHVFSHDARGNGGSRWPAGPLDQVFHAERLADDLRLVAEAVTARLGGSAPAYLGHSLGSASALDLAIEGRLPRFPALMLIDPPVYPGAHAKCRDEAVRSHARLLAITLKRRADWSSVEAFCERLKSLNGVFSRFPGAMLQAYGRSALKPKPEGGFTLCCPPEVEHAIYEAHRVSGSWDKLARVSAPLELVGADPNRPDHDWISNAIVEMAAAMKHAHLTVLEGAGHLMISEEPERLLALVRRWLGCG